MCKFGIIFPCYNEEKRLENGVQQTLLYLKSHNFTDFKIYIVDNASTDATESIGEKLQQKYKQVSYFRISDKGVGAAFRKGVFESDDEIIGYMDIDLSTDIHHIKDMLMIFENDKEVGVVNASRLCRGSKTTGRKWYRKLTSYGLTFLLKIFLKMKASDSICGFKFFRRDVLLPIMNAASNENGWFYIIELLLRAERQRIKIAELPVAWQDETSGSKVNVRKQIEIYLKNIFLLRKKFIEEGIL